MNVWILRTSLDEPLYNFCTWQNEQTTSLCKIHCSRHSVTSRVTELVRVTLPNTYVRGSGLLHWIYCRITTLREPEKPRFQSWREGMMVCWETILGFLDSWSKGWFDSFLLENTPCGRKWEKPDVAASRGFCWGVSHGLGRCMFWKHLGLLVRMWSPGSPLSFPPPTEQDAIDLRWRYHHSGVWAFLLLWGCEHPTKEPRCCTDWIWLCCTELRWKSLYRTEFE
jgi:hypothetical protein